MQIDTRLNVALFKNAISIGRRVYNYGVISTVLQTEFRAGNTDVHQKEKRRLYKETL